jgi:hypothetical protein
MDEEIIKKKFELLNPSLNERTRRLWTGAEAQVLGRGGISIVSKATGIDRHTISRGMKELKRKERLDPNRIRRPGAGRRKTTDKDKTLKIDIEKLIEPTTMGHPESSLRWTTKSVRNISNELKKMGHYVSYRLVARLLPTMGYSLQANRKTKEGRNHPDRNTQFEYISSRVTSQQHSGNPAISVDAKKKELVGNFKNSGQEWRPKGKPEEVRIHDFAIKELGKVCPYGVYDLTQNKGWVSVGIDHDTASFAVESIRQWWKTMGKETYPHASSLLITADCGGSNGYRNRLWKHELQKFTNESGLNVTVHHFPPGTSKWNKIEHKLFSFISKNWRGRPLISHAIIINLIASTKTKTGLKVKCRLDKKKYPTGIRITDDQMEKINIKRDTFHGEWNYTIIPNSNRNG